MHNEDNDLSIFLKEGYYRSQLELTNNITENINKLYSMYIERLGSTSSEKKIKETLLEYVTIFANRDLDGSEIVAHIISMVGRKSDSSKKNLSYLVGCLRNILENGICSTNSKAENKVILAIESKYNIKLSSSGKRKTLQLITTYGINDVLVGIINNNFDIETQILTTLESAIVKATEDTSH